LSEFTENIKRRLRLKIDQLRLSLAQTSEEARVRARGLIRETQFLEKLLQETEKLEEEY
jgi:hypothetical protein